MGEVDSRNRAPLGRQIVARGVSPGFPAFIESKPRRGDRRPPSKHSAYPAAGICRPSGALPLCCHGCRGSRPGLFSAAASRLFPSNQSCLTAPLSGRAVAGHRLASSAPRAYPIAQSPPPSAPSRVDCRGEPGTRTRLAFSAPPHRAAAAGHGAGRVCRHRPRRDCTGGHGRSDDRLFAGDRHSTAARQRPHGGFRLRPA